MVSFARERKVHSYASVSELRTVVVVAGRKMNDNRVHVNVKKSKFEHTCEGGGGRKRQLKTRVLTAAASPVRKLLKKTTSAETLSSSVVESGLPAPHRQQAQRFVRMENSTSWEQYVMELHYLPNFLDDLKGRDPDGRYICETHDDVYNGIEIRAFRRYFISWGAAGRIINDTPLLYLMVLDGGHMKSAFGGICLAAVVATANSKIFPAAWAVVDSENEENCVWFVEHVLQCFCGIDFVWMTDQGTALTCDAIGDIFERENQFESLCAKHVIKTLEVARARKEISGSMSGVRELIYRFARSRTVEWGDKLLSEIRHKNPDVADYLKERRTKIEAAAFLRQDRKRGGRITSQLVESFFNMCRPFRERGLVEGIIWLCKKFQQIQVEERESLMRWKKMDYNGPRFSVLSRAASAKFLNLVGHKSEQFVVKDLQKSDLELSGKVVKKVDGSVHHVRISRTSVGCEMVIECHCLTRQEFGFPCARALQLMLDGSWCDDGLPEVSVSKFLTCSTWKKQCEVDIVIPPIPSWLKDFNKTNPSASLKTLLQECAGGVLSLFPPRIPAPAGRPKVLKRAKKAFNSHFARLKSSTEKGDAPKNVKKRELETESDNFNGDDEAIVFDRDVEEFEDGEEECESEESDQEIEKQERHQQDVPKKVKSILELAWRDGTAGKRKMRAEATCLSCGDTGHKWPKCRARNIELMLVNIKAMVRREEVFALHAVE